MIVQLLTVIDVGLLLIFGIFLSYLALLSCAAAFSSKGRRVSAPPRHLFAVVIPAHDEELAIEKTLRSVYAMEYPGALFDAIVVADNCSDRTPDIARSLGATVMERTDAVRKGKGYALRWCFDRLLSSGRGYDAVVVIDADSEASPNLLAAFNACLLDGAMCVQAADIVEPRPGVWSPEVIRLAFTLYNVVRPLGRRALGFSTTLHGNGMCFAVRTLRAVPWEAFALTEDLEYGLSLLLNGVAIAFAPDAAVTATMPGEARNTESQRARWERGRRPVVRRYKKKIIAAWLRRPSLRYVEALVDLLMPPLVNMLAAVALVGGIHLLVLAFGVDAVSRLTIAWGVVFLMGSAHVLVGMHAAGADRTMYRALLYVPRYAWWKLTLYARLLRFGNPHRWIRTAREQSATMKELI